MAAFYCDSVGGSDANNGTTWALKKATIAGAIAVMAAGDDLYVSSTHAETAAATTTLTFPGTAAAPNRCISVDKAGSPQPPTASAILVGASVTTTGTFSILVNGSVYVYGHTFSAGTGSGLGNLSMGPTSGGHVQEFDTCKFRIVGTNASSAVIVGAVGNIAGNNVTWTNCTVRFAAATQGIQPYTGTLNWNGTGIESGGTVPTNLFEFVGTNSTGRGITVIAENISLVNGSTTQNIVGDISGGSNFLIRYSRMIASWTGLLVGGTQERGSLARMHCCDNADTNTTDKLYRFNGTMISDIVRSRTGGASDGTTPKCWNMTTNANAAFPHVVLVSEEMPFWNDTTAASKTVTVEFLHDTAAAAGQGAGASNAFRNDEVWLEVLYLGDGSFPIGTRVTSKPTTVLTTPADCASSSVTWTTTGLTTPAKQKVSVTFTPQEKGVFVARVALAKASKTIYVDPYLTVT